MRATSKKGRRGAGRMYGAKLLFQWRVVQNGKALQRRLCEERVILLRARSPRAALVAAKRYGAKEAFKAPQRRPRGREVYFEFVGVIDMDDLAVTDLTEYPTEVWYELRERLRPMERKASLLVPERRMRAVYIPSQRPGRIVV